MNKNQSGSNFYMLTAQILNDKNLNHAEKLTMAILNGLADEEGKCWPSNEWLGEKLELKIRAVQDIINKLEKYSYIRREIISCKNDPFKKYRIIYTSTNFKFSLPDAENCTLGNAENCAIDTQKTACIIDKKESLIEKKEKGAAPQPSADASELCKFFIEKIKERNPKFKEPKLEKWIKEFECLLRIDKRDLQETKDIIEWTYDHSFWKANCLSPSTLRKHYDKMSMQKQSSSEQENVDENRRYALEAKKAFPDRLKNLTINPKYAMNLSAGKEVPFSLPQQTFKAAFISMFGGKYEPNRSNERRDPVDSDTTE